jgi:hypothetical protein
MGRGIDCIDCTASAEYQGAKTSEDGKMNEKQKVKGRLGGKQKITAARRVYPRLKEVDIRQKGLRKKDGFLVSSRCVLPLQFWGSLCPSKGVAGSNALGGYWKLEKNWISRWQPSNNHLGYEDVTPCGEVYGKRGGKLRRT